MNSMTLPTTWTDALKDELLGAVPGCEFVDDAGPLDAANTATFATAARSRLIARPATVAELVSILRFATHHGLKVYPVSRGRNWGFGSRVPVQSAAILIELARMDRILDYDPHHGTLRVEPGVTFAMAARFLVDRGGHHFVNAIGGSPHASLIGNVLERGDGGGLYCERASHVCCFEVVLADGTVVETGYGGWPGSKLSQLSRHGVGPSMQDLFVQSNLGIVTKMTLWLQQTPKNLRLYQFQLREPDDLAPAIDTFRALLKRNIIAGPIVFWNDYKVAAGSAQYPWEATDGTTPLRRDRLRAISNAYRAWFGHGGIYVDHAVLSVVAEYSVRRAIKRALGPSAHLSSLSSRKIALFKSLDRLPFGRDRSRLVREWETNPMLGAISEQSVVAQYWRKRRPVPDVTDPDRDGCGVLSNSFELPLDGAAIAEFVSEFEAVILGHGFEPILSLTIVNDRYAKCFQQLMFDRDVAGEDDKALACHSEVFALIENRGFTHARVDIMHMGSMRRRRMSTELRDRIAGALDPTATLAPGRYEF